MGCNPAPNGLSVVARFLLQIDEAQIVAHEAHDPNAVVDPLESKPLTGRTVEILPRVRCTQMRPQCVTMTSGSWRG
jgi:hypothetical protein